MSIQIKKNINKKKKKQKTLMLTCAFAEISPMLSAFAKL
jgi:hypothetical protein